MIEVKNLVKSFSGNTVIDNVTATLESGKVNLIIGTSGSGKTVFMKSIVGLITPDSGNIFYGDHDFMAMNKSARKELRTKVGMLFQGSALFDSYNVEENVMFPLNMFTKMNETQKLQRVNEVLARVNLVDANKKYPSEISGGMKKRVALARAIVLNPKYLFCDEPNSGLDPQTSLVIDKLIKKLTIDFNMTTVVNTHDMNTVMESGDKIVYLYQGRKEWEGTSEDIIYSDHERLNSFIFASDFLKEAKQKRMDLGRRDK